MLPRFLKRILGHRPVAQVLLSNRPGSLESHCKLPTKGMAFDAGYDIYGDEDVVVPAGKTASVSTSLHLSVPPGYYYTIEGRSSLYAKRIVPYRGIIDATYTGPLTIFLQNFSNEDYQVKAGDRVAQVVFHKVVEFDFKLVDEFDDDYNQRGKRGYGSTGR